MTKLQNLLIRQDDLSAPEVTNLIREHLEEMHAITPPESVHAMDIETLRSSAITFWTAWLDNELAGCGALQQLDHSSGEIKSMRTARAHRGKGVARAMLEYIISEAERRRYSFLFLETGTMTEFAPARNLYGSYGFGTCPPFASYTEDSNSVFMSKALPEIAR